MRRLAPLIATIMTSSCMVVSSCAQTPDPGKAKPDSPAPPEAGSSATPLTAAPLPSTVAGLALLEDATSLRGAHVQGIAVYEVTDFQFIQDSDDGEPQPRAVKRRIELHLSPDTKLAELAAGSPEDGAVRLYHFTTAYIERAGELFGDHVDFSQQRDYQVLELELTRPELGNIQYITSPSEFVLPRGEVLTAALVYHEVGHRLFWMLEDRAGIPMGGPNHYVHCGLIEYFATSFADQPVVAFGPPPLIRDVSRGVHFPEDFATLADTERRFEAAYAAVRDTQPWHFQYLAMLTSIPGYTEVQDGHESGLLIAHPLWEIRAKLGAADTDRLVAQAILLLPAVMKSRASTDGSLAIGAAEAAQWFDLLRALLAADMEASAGANAQVILGALRAVGYPVDELKLASMAGGAQGSSRLARSRPVHPRANPQQPRQRGQ